MNNIQDNETYRRVHFAVMAIENGAKKTRHKRQRHARPFAKTRTDTQPLVQTIRRTTHTEFAMGGRRHQRNTLKLGG